MLQKSASVGSELNREVEITHRIPSRDVKLGSSVEKGSYGVVRRANWLRTIVAVKVLPTFKARQLTSFLREMSFACGLRHPNIVATMGAITDSDSYSGLVMELMPWGSMSSSLKDPRRRKHFNESKLLRSLLSVCRGGAYLASVGVIHRDISSKNVFVGVGFEDIKLGDFGISSLLKQHELDREDPMYGNRLMDSKTLFVGAPAYKAPELNSSRPIFSEASDVFAFAIVAWEMLTTLWTRNYARPWSDISSTHALAKAITSGKRPILEPEYFSVGDEKAIEFTGLIAIIEQCWHESRHKRPTFIKIHDEIEKRYTPRQTTKKK